MVVQLREKQLYSIDPWSHCICWNDLHLSLSSRRFIKFFSGFFCTGLKCAKTLTKSQKQTTSSPSCMKNSLNSVTRFFKVPSEKCAFKSAQNIWCLFAILKNITFKVNTSVVIFGKPLKEIGLLYYLTFGHTVPKVVRTR